MHLITTNRHGVADRIAACLFSLKAGQALGRTVEFFWETNSLCNCAFEKLFVTEMAVRNVEPLAEKVEVPGSGAWIVLHEKYENAALQRLSLEKGPIVRVRIAELGFRSYVGVSKIFFPSESIRKSVQDFKDRCFSSKMIGVHIRSTDFWRPDVDNVESYFQKIDAILFLDPDCRIFLATDDGGPVDKRNPYAPVTPLGIEGRMRERYKDKLVTYPVRSLIRAEEAAIIDAVTVLFLLSECDFFIRGRGNFSYLAETLQIEKAKKENVLKPL